MDHITVHLFRNFSILYRGREVVSLLAKSSKSISVLKYLILNQDRPVPVSDLVEVFWNDEGGANPENALKTLISRMRKAISHEAPELWNCIVTEQGTYQWKPSLPCDVDVFAFENLCLGLLSDVISAPERRDAFLRAIYLYRGNLDVPFVTDEWLRGRGMYYQELYLKTVARFVVLLKEERDYETIINICRTALNIESFDETLNLELMYALKETSQNNAALIHYRYSTDMYYKYLGIDPSDKMLEFYKQLIKADLGAKDNMAVIRDRLVQQKPDGKAFVCDYSIFKDIYQLQLRNVERWGVQMFLALIMVEHADQGGEFNPFVLDRIMQDLMEILISCLRKGDIITRYSSSQFAVLLQMTAQTDGEIVIDRIRRQFYATNTHPYTKLIFQIDPVIDHRGDGAG